ncbi:MAG: WD40/YVTN/BNR-like repeat-containing protein, partial [Longimicrobiales bacterium]
MSRISSDFVLRTAASAACALALAAVPAMSPAQVSAQDEMSGVERAFSDLSYRNVGPSRGGRVTAVAGHRDHPLTFYMGATGGGVWKTENYGTNWRPISDGYFETGSIGSIRVAPSNADIVYVGTGSDGIRSNVISGRGLYYSGDAGETWERRGLVEMGQLAAVEIDPNNPDVAYVAALGNPWAKTPDRGVYRTTDAGRSWNQVLFTSDSVGAIDLEINPANPNEIYAAMWRGQRRPWTIISGMEASAREDGIWKSTDGGDNWEYLSEGLPAGLIGKIDLSVSADMPNRIYALVETTDPDEGLYRSDDLGASWKMVSNARGIMNRPFYYTGVTVDPTDADHVYVNNEGYYESTDGGVTLERRQTPHGDNHDTWINPDNPLIQVQSNDGGANVTLDGGSTWSTQSNQPTAELYQVDIDDQFPYWLYAGQQDNSTIRVPSNPPGTGSQGGHQGNWQAVGGCETGPAVPKPGDPTIVYANCKGRFGRYNQVTGQEKQYYVGFANLYGVNPAELTYRFQRTVPIEVSPHDASTVYHGSQFVHKTTDEGVTWEQISPDLTAFRPERQQVSGGPITRDITGEEHYSVLYTIEESPLTPGVIWTGANDGLVQVTRDGGQTWKDVTPADMPPEGRIQTIDPSPHNPAKAYFAGYRTLLGDLTPFIYKTEDYGESWTLLTPGNNGIPSHHATRAVREDTEREGLLYAGTEFGMYISFNDGESWEKFQFNLPRTPITDIKVHQGDLVLSTMGRAF